MQAMSPDGFRFFSDKLYIYLVADVQHGDVVVLGGDAAKVHQKVEDISHGRGSPPSPLVVELVESWSIRHNSVWT